MIARKRTDQRRRASGFQKNDPAIGRECDVEIEAIGRNGDGIARINGRPVFVPLALPGDRLRVRLIAKRADGYAAEVIEEQKQSERAEPACPHYGHCGGCHLQHLRADDYHQWQVQQIKTALRSRGFADAAIRPIIKGKVAARRRIRLAFKPVGGRMPYKGRKSSRGPEKSSFRAVDFGFRARQSQDIVPIEACPVTLPSIIAMLPPLKILLGKLDLAQQGGELHLTATDTGIDLLLEAARSPSLADLEALGAFADEHDLARLAFRPDARSAPEPIAARRPARVTMANIPVDLPIGAFLQATEPAETAIRRAVHAAIGDGNRVADLFSGCGAFGLPLAADGRRVIAFERDRAMISALKAAAIAAGVNQRLTAEPRDLDRQPLDQTDLKELDAVIVDPPRSGARNQATALAASSVEKIAMVSCNPATFARDARLLVDGGYQLSWVQPIDAFLWSAEIELVGAFERHIPS